MTDYRIWSGLNTIGGNIVEVRTKQARVICDFGLSVPSEEPTAAENMPELEKLLLRGELPAIPWLYDTAEFTVMELPSYQEAEMETVLFVSHLHLDHMGGLRYLPEGTCVYMSKDSYKLYQTLIEAGEETASCADIRFFVYGETIEVGDITVTPKLSDHDVTGACALFIETDELKLIHSGDLRLSGDYPERVWKWAEEARQWHPDVLLLEGTTFSFEESETTELTSERQLREAWQHLLKEERNQLIVVNPYIRNVERMRCLAHLTEEAGRVIVFEPEYAAVLTALYPEERWTVVTDELGAELPYAKSTVTLREMQEQPANYVLQNSYKNRHYLAEFTGGMYCHSNGEPLGDYDPRYQVLKNFLNGHHFQWKEMGTSGHATKEELIEVAQTVQAKTTIPWHTFRPEKFFQALNEVHVPSMLPELSAVYSAEGAIPDSHTRVVPVIAGTKEEKNEADNTGNK
ncbi:MBL fold metallo-hydrolase [Atopococcus tabaci]|uniref:MBL fold metallo-hydrolase n=1 Tax=Atopococcus tabaci TaxID=269774 RepID=UPI00240A0AE1|nr:MBL fold metallo-hydrolase [Atopococcus tabaci]